MTPLLLSLSGLAQDVDVPAINAQLFRPSIDATGLLWTDDTNQGESGHTSARMLISYANEPLVYTFQTGERVAVLSDLLQMNLMGGYTWGRLRLGADLPVLLYSAGDTGSETSLGDVGIDGRISLLERSAAPLGLALSGRLTAPTATASLPVGVSGLGWEASVIADAMLGRTLLATNLGTRGMPGTTLENVDWDDQFFFRAGAAHSLSDRAGASIELTGNLTYGELGNSAAAPIEGLLGGWLRPGGKNIVLRGGVGTGLTTGIGAPRLRTVLAVAYEPSLGVDTDGDGIGDISDECPERPEDVDGHNDRDGCPDPTMVTVRFIDSEDNPIPGVRYTLEGSSSADGASPMWVGNYALDAEASGYQSLRTTISVPGGESHEEVFIMEAVDPGRLVVRVSDLTGGQLEGVTWLIDGAEQGDIGQVARSSLLPGSYRIAAHAEGYLRASEIARIRSDLSTTVEITLRPTTTSVTADRIELGGTILFETATDTIQEESIALLNDVVTIMQEYTEIRKIRIEGHTDSRGKADDNLALSDARAASVARFLIERGVAAERLSSIGYGESKPVSQRNSERAWAQNRRIDIFIEERAEPEPEEPLTPSVPDAPVEDAPAEDAPAEDAPAEDAPAEDAPTEDAPAEDAPTEDAPTEDGSNGAEDGSNGAE